MSGPFRKLHHVCVVVYDIDAAQRFYVSVGIGPWLDLPPFTDLTELDVPDREAFLQLVYRFATVGDIQIQLCQPGDGDTHQRRSSTHAAKASSTSASTSPTPMQPTPAATSSC